MATLHFLPLLSSDNCGLCSLHKGTISTRVNVDQAEYIAHRTEGLVIWPANYSDDRFRPNRAKEGKVYRVVCIGIKSSFKSLLARKCVYCIQ